MFKFFQQILDTILAPFKIIILIFEMLVDLITIAVEFLTSIFSFLPASWLVIAMILVSVSILYKILGRESSS